MKRKIDISLNLMPSFYNKHLGLKYGESYYFDPEYRAKIEIAEAEFNYEILGKYGVGTLIHSPSPAMYIQAVDLFNAVMGSPINYPEDATFETVGGAWEDTELFQILEIDPLSAAYHPLINRLLAQQKEMEKLYGEKAEIFYLKSGLYSIHGAYTTAVQLCGEKFFIWMMEAPDASISVLHKIIEIYDAIYDRMRKEIKAPPPNKVILGDCSACMLSPDLYRDIVLPVNQKFLTRTSDKVYHSCGASTHLLKEFAKLGNVNCWQLGFGTDYKLATELLHNELIMPLIDPKILRNSSTDEVNSYLIEVLEQTEKATNVTIGAWSLDRETPIKNLLALYQAFEEYKNCLKKSCC